jgi:hypothetical protein
LPRASTLAHATVAELGGNAVMRDRLLWAHFFNPVSQFSTTVTGDEGSTSAFTIRNFLPSRVASYRYTVLAALAKVCDRNKNNA